MANGRVHWAALANSWAANRGRDEPQRTAAALKTIYNKIVKGELTVRETPSDHDGEATIGRELNLTVPDTSSSNDDTTNINLGSPCPNEEVGPSERRPVSSIENLSNVSSSLLDEQRKRYWSSNEIERLVSMVHHYKILGGGRVQWDDLTSAWESLRRPEDPPRSKEALKCTYARAARQRRQMPQNVAYTSAVLRQSGPLPDLELRGADSDAQREGVTTQAFERRVEMPEVTVECSPVIRPSSPLPREELNDVDSASQREDTTVQALEHIELSNNRITTESSQDLCEQHPLTSGPEECPVVNDGPVAFGAQPREDDSSAESLEHAAQNRHNSAPVAEDALSNIGSAEESTSTEGSSTTESNPRSRSTRHRESSPPGSHAEDADMRRQRSKALLWTSTELAKLSNLVEEHREASGRINWDSLRNSWDNSLSGNEPVRSLAALKSAYGKIARALERAQRQARPYENAQHDEQEVHETTDANEDDQQMNDIGSVEGLDRETSGPDSALETSEANRNLRDLMRERFNRYYRVALESHDRQPIRRPNGEIPEEILRLGNDIIREQLSCRNSTRKKTLTSLNAAVYAIGKTIATVVLEGESEKSGKTHQKLRDQKAMRDYLIKAISLLSHELKRRERNQGAPKKRFLELSRLQRVSTSTEIQRLLVRYKDELGIVNSAIKAIQDSLKRIRERRRGYPAVAREPREQEVNVPVAEVREHWKSIIGEPQQFQPSDDLKAWAQGLGEESNNLGMELPEEVWANIFAKIKPWKATGPDGIQGFWWKKLPEAKERLKMWCKQALQRPHQNIPKWLCRGKVVLIPKGSSQARGPGDFRPIACLNTCYKVLTAMIAQQILRTASSVLPQEQVALRKGIWGCIHAHTLDQTICKDAIRRNKPLHMLWVDMTKAFDSVSHGAIKWILARSGVPSPTRRLLSVIMSRQSVRYCGYQNGRMVRSKPLDVKRGVMQGDTLSPLLFCMAIAPISAKLRNSVSPYRTATGALSPNSEPLEINHQFYMDDLKVYTSRWDDIAKAKQGIEKVAGELGLQMNPTKCAVNSLNVPQQLTATEEMENIPVLGSSSLYKYLGAEQNALINIDELWTRVVAKSEATAVRIMQSNLTVRQKVNGYNQVVIPKLKYAFSCVVYGTGKFQTMRKRARTFDETIRKLLADCKMRYGHSCTARLYANKEDGGLGLKSAEEELEHTVVYNWCYVASRPELQIPYLLCESLRRSNKRSLSSDFYSVLAENRLENEVTRDPEATIHVRGTPYTTATKAARAISTLVHGRWARTRLHEWKQREVASRVIAGNTSGNPDCICLKDSFLWSKTGWVSSEVLRNVWAAQEGSLPTKGSASGQTIWPNSNQLCRLRCPAKETAEHIVSACDYWRTGLMVNRHDEVARVIYKSLKKKYGLNSVVTNTHVPHVVEGNDVVLHWNDRILTTEYIKHDRPDIVVRDNKAKTIWIIDIAVAWYTRITEQEKKKICKYGVNSCLPQNTSIDDYHPGSNLKADLQAQHGMSVEVVPIVVGTCGECSANLRRYVRLLNLPDKTEAIIERMQRCAVLGTHRIIKSHLSKGDGW
ncbi:reverse transcriptase [Ostertagia ostertagi]